MTEPVTSVRDHMRLPLRLSAGVLATRFFEHVRRGEIFGNRCPSCERVFVPPRSFCAGCWCKCEGWERVSDRGIVETFVVVGVPFYGQQVEIPYVLAHVRLDGADVPLLHLVGVAAEDGGLRTCPVTMGMHVRAVWRDASERTGFLNEDVDHFEPEGT